MIYSLFRIVLFAVLFNVLGASLDDDDDEPKFNVIIFLAELPTDGHICYKGLKCLNFKEKARVKHCANNENSDDSVNIEENIKEYLSTNSDCKQLLKASIFSLLSYCKNVLGMTTAVASLYNDSFTNGLRFKKSDDYGVQFHSPKLVRDTNIGDLPLYDAFPQGPKIKFNSRPHRWRKRNRYITKPEHTEVFKIRSRRQIRIVKEEVPPKSDWDIFGLKGTLRLTFFGKLLESCESKKEKELEQQQQEEQEEPQIGKVYDNSLFDLVSETMLSIQQENCENGFLMVVIGGCLKQLSDSYSPLVQSVKHVVENTDDKHTIIIVTGSCPRACNHNKVPVYVRAPSNINGICAATQLYDIPYAIKNFLTDVNIGGHYLSRRKKRSKRDVQTDIKNSNDYADDSSPNIISPPYKCILLAVIVLNR